MTTTPDPHRRDPYAGFPGTVGRTFRESTPAWPARVRQREGAPDIVVVLIDDMGYSDIGPFGAEIPTGRCRRASTSTTASSKASPACSTRTNSSATTARWTSTSSPTATTTPTTSPTRPSPWSSPCAPTTRTSPSSSTSPTTPSTALQAKPEDLARHKGRYADGWDELRATCFARQLAAGHFPPGTELPDRNSEAGYDVGPWDELTDVQKKLYARYMEVYAAMVDNVDRNLGRLTDTLASLGELDNTIIVFTSDNSGTGEGGPEGTRSYFSRFVHHPDLPDDWNPDVEREIELIGGPQSLVHYPRGWGMASNTPFRLYKGQTYAGGVRVPFVLSWPAGLPRKEGDTGVRTQYQYVTDILPTLLELAGIERPLDRHRRPVQSLDGISFTSVLRDSGAASTHPEQYCEMTGNRSYYRDGWKLVTLHRPGTPYDDGEWALYDLRTDPTEIHDVSAEHPIPVKELSAAWEAAAWRNGVFPLADGSGALALRGPDAERLRRPVTLLPGTPELERYRSSRLISFRSFTIEVALDEHRDGDEGVLVSHGDQGGGYSLYVEDGQLRFAYNQYGELHETAAGPLPAGTRLVTVEAEAVADLKWEFRLHVDGVRTGRLGPVHQLIGMAPFQGISVGVDRKSPVSWPVHERHRSFRYTGTLHSVTYVPGEPAPYDPETVARALREAAAAFE